MLASREGSQLEFKETFSLGNRARYARSLASFANNRGGYIVFGVTNDPRRLKGVNVTSFDSCDPATLSEFLGSHFSPELDWDMESVQVHGVTLGFIYAHELVDKPMIATVNSGSEIQEGAIYYRYRGRSTSIRFAELRGLLDERIARERRAWLQHLGTIGRAGPTNVGVVDVVRGKIFGGQTPFLIDEALLRKLKFIRSGRFAESGGEPTLQLVGDVQPVAGVVADRPVPIAIHSEDLITAFLAVRPLQPEQAKTYLRETVFQSSAFVPVHYFRRLSGLSETEVRALFKDCVGVQAKIRGKVLDRLFRGDRVAPIGKAATVKGVASDMPLEKFANLLEAAPDAKSERSLLYAALRRNPRLVDTGKISLDVGRLSEAVTHLSDKDIAAQQTTIMELMLRVFETRFGSMLGNVRSQFRKAVCRCDEALFAAGRPGPGT